MNKFFIAAIAAATILPTAAMAQPYDHHDKKVVIVEHKGPARVVVGGRVEPGFIARHDVVSNPRHYRLARPAAGTRWLKVRNDAVLVNLRSGRVLNIAYNLFR